MYCFLFTNKRQLTSKDFFFRTIRLSLAQNQIADWILFGCKWIIQLKLDCFIDGNNNNAHLYIKITYFYLNCINSKLKGFVTVCKKVQSIIIFPICTTSKKINYIWYAIFSLLYCGKEFLPSFWSDISWHSMRVDSQIYSKNLFIGFFSIFSSSTV